MSSSYTKNALKVLKLFSSHIVEFLITSVWDFQIHS